MAREVTMYKSKYGNVFETEDEADLEDLNCELTSYIESYYPLRDVSVEDIIEMMNNRTILNLLEKVRVCKKRIEGRK